MRYELRASAYDVMDMVHVAVVIRGSIEGAEEGVEWYPLAATSVAGTGEDDAREWARDALVALLEAL